MDNWRVDFSRTASFACY